MQILNNHFSQFNIHSQLSLILLVVFFYSCDRHTGNFVDYDVTFYLDHPNYKVIPALFEQRNEQVLVRDAHNEGATFETKTEQVLTNYAYTSYQTFHQNKITIENNCELNSSIDLNCREFLDSLSVIKTQHPAKYTTRSYEVVLVNGNGALVPAVYMNRTYSKLVADGQLLPNTDATQDKEQVVFRLPFGISIDDYIQNEFNKNGVLNCISGFSYTIN